MSGSTGRRLRVRAVCVLAAALGAALTIASAALAEDAPPAPTAPPAATTPAPPAEPAPDPTPTDVKPDPGPVQPKATVRPKSQAAPASSVKPAARPTVTPAPTPSVSSSSGQAATSSSAVARVNAKAQAAAKANARAAAARAEARRRAAKAKAERVARAKARAATKALKPTLVPLPAAPADANDGGASWLVILIPFALVGLGVGAVVLWSRRRRDPLVDAAVIEPLVVAPVAKFAAPMPVASEWDTEPFEELVEPPPMPDEPEVCTVSAWRGYVKWQFYATVRSGGVDYPVGESHAFRASGNGIPDETPAARAAYDALVVDLARDGWTASDGAAEGWYGERFVRAGSNTPAPTGEDVFDVGSLLAGHEDEEPVALPDDGAPAWGNGVAVAMDDGDQRIPG
jgi:hypothetical protein